MYLSRYRCLEAIVSGAFPHENTRTAKDLVELGQRLGYSMPDITNQSRPNIKLEELVRQPYPSGSSNSGQTPGKDSATSQPQHTEPPHIRTRSSSEEPNVSLIRDTSGNEHYIGPSGTLNFLSRLRKLVDEDQGAAVSPAGGQDGAAAHKFTQDDTAQALEADHDTDANDQQESTAMSAVSPDGHSPGSITSAIARDFTRMPAADMDEILKHFPPDDKLELLVDSYFKNVHSDFPLFHRPTFEEEYELFLVQAKRRVQIPRVRQRASPLDWGWIGCLHMMVVFGSISNPRIEGIDHTILRRRSVTVARALLPQFISKCTLTNVRVLLLLSLFLHNNNERNAAWNLVGAATRISFALGLHRSDMNSSFRPLERELRKWVFCTLYSFEQFLASSLGRPSGLQEVDVEIVPPREGFLDGGSGTDAKLVSLSLKLQAILARTRLIDVSRRKAELVTPFVPSPTVDEVLESLDEWKENITRIPEFDVPWIKDAGSAFPNHPNSTNLEELKASLSWKSRAQLRAVLLTHVQYNYIVVVATRPLLLRDMTHLRQSGSSPSDQPSTLSKYADRCVEHACQLSYLIILLDSFEIINGLSGLDVFFGYCGAMCLVLRLLQGAKKTPTGDGTQMETQGADEEMRMAIRNLVRRVQGVLNRAEKSGSMRRFARVVDAFADCVDKSNPRLQSLPNVSGQHLAPPQQHHVRFDESQFGYGNAGGGTYDTMLPDQAQFASMPAFGDTSMEGFVGLFPWSTFGAGGPNGPMTHFAGPEGGPGPGPNPGPGWVDMEMLLGGYSVPS